MIINFIVILMILAFGYHYSHTYQQYQDSSVVRKKYIKIISVILILQSGLRNVAVGSDTYGYFLSFESMKEISWSEVFQNFVLLYQYGEGKDPGYGLFEKTIQIFSGEYQILLLLIAILFFSALGNFIFMNTVRLSDAVLAFLIYSVLFYAFFSITGHRQTIATAGALFAFEFIKKRKLLWFFLIILVAATVHKSVLLFLPFYFIAPNKNVKILNYTVLFLFPVFMIFRNGISQYFKTLAGYEEYGINEQAGTFTFTGMFLMIYIAALFRSRYIIQNNKNAKYALNAFALALLFLPLTWVNPSAMRTVQYFSLFMLILIPEIIYSLKEISLHLRRDGLFVAIFVLLLLFIKTISNMAPYGFFWEEMPLPDNY